MKKMIPLMLTLALLVTGILGFSMVAGAEDYSAYNLLDTQTATFEGGTGSWIQDAGLGTITISSEADKGVDGSAAMLITPRTNGWDSPKLDILPILLSSGVGTYNLSAYVSAAGEGDGAIRMLFRDKDNSHGYDASALADITEDEFVMLEITFEVTEVDTTAGTVTLNVLVPADMTDPAEKTVDTSFNVCFDSGAGPIYVDNVVLVNMNDVDGGSTEPTAAPTNAPEDTADVSALSGIAYAVAAISGLGALVAGKKRAK